MQQQNANTASLQAQMEGLAFLEPAKLPQRIPKQPEIFLI